MRFLFCNLLEELSGKINVGFLENLVQDILDIFKKNYKKPKLWTATSSVLVVLFMLLPYINSNFFYYTRMEKRIDILQKVIALDNSKIACKFGHKEITWYSYM